MKDITNMNKNDFLHKENNFFQTVISNSSVMAEQQNQRKSHTLPMTPFHTNRANNFVIRFYSILLTASGYELLKSPLQGLGSPLTRES